MKKDVLVIGLGRFGSTIVENLLSRDERVTIVDIDEKVVKKYASKCENALVCDSADEDVLKQLGVNNFDEIVVAIGNNIEASLITVLLLKELGASRIVAKANNKNHRLALEKIGLPPNKIIMPEAESGRAVGISLSYPVVADYIPLLGGKFSLIETHPKKSFLTGKSFRELNLRSTYKVMVPAIKRNYNEIILPNADTIIEEADSLIVIGENHDLRLFEERLQKDI